VSGTDNSLRTRSDERRLAAYALDPTPDRLRELVERFQPLARSLAARYRGRSEPFEDLLQVANVGLLKAIQGYDPERQKPSGRPSSFSAYAVPTILGELRRHFRDRVGNLRLPRGLQESAAKLEAALEQLTERLRRSPTLAELASETGLSAEDVAETLVARDARWTTSFEAPSNELDSESPADHLGRVDLGFDRVEAKVTCQQTTLDPLEKASLEMRFIAGMTQAEIGERLGCSQMQVSRISRRGLAKLLAAVQGDANSQLAA
jgi:RNA polymerase sigma-B factor